MMAITRLNDCVSHTSCTVVDVKRKFGSRGGTSRLADKARVLFTAELPKRKSTENLDIRI